MPDPKLTKAQFASKLLSGELDDWVQKMVEETGVTKPLPSHTIDTRKPIPDLPDWMREIILDPESGLQKSVLPPAKQGSTFAGGVKQSLYEDYVRPMASLPGVMGMLAGDPEGDVSATAESKLSGLLEKIKNSKLMQDERGEIKLPQLGRLADLTRVKGQKPEFKAGSMRMLESALKAGEGLGENWEPLANYLDAFAQKIEAMKAFARGHGATSPNTPVARNNYEAIIAQKMALENKLPFTHQAARANDISMASSKVPNLNRAYVEQGPLSSIRGFPGKTEELSQLNMGNPRALPIDVHALSGVGAMEEHIAEALPGMRKIMAEVFNKKPRNFTPAEVYQFSADLWRNGLEKVLGRELRVGDFAQFWEGVKKLKGQGPSPGMVSWLKDRGLLQEGAMMNPEALAHAIEQQDPAEFYGRELKNATVAVPESWKPDTSAVAEAAADMHAKPIMNLTAKNQGTTYNIRQGDMAGKPAFAVAAYPERSMETKGAPSLQVIQDYIKKNWDLLADPENSVGTWWDKDAGTFVLDISKTLPDKEAALALGKKMNQKAIFDLGKMEELYLKRTPAQVAGDYAEAKGFPAPAKHPPVKVNESVGQQVADAYDKMKHDPTDPAVKKAYDTLKSELSDQFEAITKRGGLQAEKWTKPGQPYASSAEMFKDVSENNHMFYFPTEQGFGTEAAAADHPLLETDPKSGLPYNDALRIVHDYLAHALGEHQFGPSGEENAFIEHAKLLSPEARKALATETRGQNSWVNFGPHMRNKAGALLKKGEEGWLPATQRPFAPQKAGLLPEWMQQTEPIEPQLGDLGNLLQKFKDLPDPELIEGPGPNASGESAASQEALNRQQSMASQGQQFAVQDASGNIRPLIGPEAVDYKPRPGETFGIRGPKGFLPLSR